ncbi:UMP kinase [Candidatus Woesebacteria bacterium]|nr:UMP kinase [Candidatus Woesebacteria bacterium]
MFFNNKEPPIVFSIGGSLIVPNGGPDTKFLTELNHFIRTYVKQGKRFFLVAGGGKLARSYRDTGKSVIGGMSDTDLDWLGIHSTRLNAHLLRTIFEDIAHPRIIENYDKKLAKWKEPVVIGAGWKPGWSTDYDAVVLAKDYGAQLIINLTNIDGVYTKDPRRYKGAKRIEKLTWADLEKLVGTKWEPGINAPFDPIAAQLARKLKLTVIVTDGYNFKNLGKIMESDSFKGTVITPFQISAGYYNREYYRAEGSAYRFTKEGASINTFLRTLANYYRAFFIRYVLNPKNCLDVGCGTGSLVKILRTFDIDAYGVEISEAALEMADKSVRPFLSQGDITKLPFKENEFDLVLTFDVLEHVDRSYIKRAIQETIRISKKYILHKIYTRENLWIRFFHRIDRSHVSVYTYRYWKRLFHENPHAALQRHSIFHLPQIMESVFLLKKKPTTTSS